MILSRSPIPQFCLSSWCPVPLSRPTPHARQRGAPFPRLPLAEPRQPRAAIGGRAMGRGTDVVEKRGPYIMSKPPSIQAKLSKQRELAKAALRRQGLLGAPTALKPTPKRSVKFNKGYTALSQTADENLVSLDSDR
uniref:Family with sequence similarity 219 member B n=1 Tax=Junco hyemalis TaxID=40217 RepID=A0A8C5JGJ5_JUNHY